MNEEMMEQPQGMAAMGMPRGQGNGAQMTVGQVVQAIMSGVDPEELLAQGVPQALIDQAMMQIMSESQPPMQEGLAGMQVTQNDTPMSAGGTR